MSSRKPSQSFGLEVSTRTRLRSAPPAGLDTSDSAFSSQRCTAASVVDAGAVAPQEEIFIGARRARRRGGAARSRRAAGKGAAVRLVSGEYVAPRLLLIVDDDDDTRALYAEYLRSAGFRTDEAANGWIGLQKAVALKPDLIVLDYKMPVMDGLEMTRWLKRDVCTRDIPLVMLTGSSEDLDGRGDWECFLEKPCIPETLETSVRAVLDRCAPEKGASESAIAARGGSR